MSYEVGDVVVVGPHMTIAGIEGSIYLVPGEVADVIALKQRNEPYSIQVKGRDSHLEQWIDNTSLTPFGDIDADGIDWGQIHDYVYEGGEGDLVEGPVESDWDYDEGDDE